MSNPGTHYTSNFANSPSPVGSNRAFGPNVLGSGMNSTPGMNVGMPGHMPGPNIGSSMAAQVASPIGCQSGPSISLPPMGPQYNMSSTLQNVQQNPSMTMQTSHSVPDSGQTIGPTQATITTTPAPDVNAVQQPPAPAPSKEFNTLTLCRLGQETVQDIVSRTQEVFQALKNIYPPNGTNQGLAHAKERKAKMQEQLRTIRILFKRLRLIYEKCQLQGMEYTHIESLLPIRDDMDTRADEMKTSATYRAILDEHIDLSELVALRNRHIKDVIDHLRRVIWEINTMLVMRRS